MAQSIQNFTLGSMGINNYLGSVETEEEAVKRTQTTTELLNLRDFQLMKWILSLREVVTAIDQNELIALKQNFELGELPVERTFGAPLVSQTDSFNFKQNKIREERTKRDILSIVYWLNCLLAGCIDSKVSGERKLKSWD